MDKFFTQKNCDRCGGDLSEGRTMSMYNEDCICIECKGKERKRSDYKQASDADNEQIKQGNYNFGGIGYTEETTDVNDFKDRSRRGLTETEWAEVNSFPYVDFETIKDINDPKYAWQCVYKAGSDQKYGRTMVSYPQKIRRGQTMGEFYGGGVVD